MKKILQINSVLNVGSTGRIAEELGQVAINNGWESYISYGRKMGSPSKSKTLKIGRRIDLFFHLVATRLFDKHGLSSKRATRKLISQIKELQPDIILLHNLHGYYINIEILFNFLKTFNKPVFWILYDCWAFTGHCAYFDLVGCNNWKSGCNNCPCKSSYPKSLVNRSANNYRHKSEIFTGVNDMHLIVHSNWLRRNVEKSFLSLYPISLIRNGINLQKFNYRRKIDFDKHYNLSNKFVILGIANIWDDRKGFKDFLSLSRYLKVDEIIVMDGLSKDQQKILPDNIISLGKAQSVEELAIIYSTANVFFNPTYEDNFPTTNLEALACGTPVITYDTGGSPEAIDQDTGFVCKKNDLDDVYNNMQIVKKNGKDLYKDKCIKRATSLFDYRQRYKDCIDLFEQHLK